MNTKKLAYCALLTSLALVLSYVESLIPLSVTVPGVKLGLPNLVIMFALYRLGGREAWIISLIRLGLVFLLFGNAFSLLYSLSGAVVSLTVMQLMKRTGKFSYLSVSVIGGVFHNLGQIICAIAILGTAQIAYYLPVLLISGIAAGAAIGIAAGQLIKRVFPNLQD